ncbi:hypothetical protein BDF14DRAFT_1815191 [Spinellus fusiger]|nr:hypothetical protein BDF14DRAFT_1815191 [Spinellus fusiger]
MRDKPTHWVTLPDAEIGRKSVKVATDQGAAANLVTKETADRLGLSIRTESPPKLQSLWNADTNTTYGQANAKVRGNGCLLKSSAVERKYAMQPTIEITEERDAHAPEEPEKTLVIQRKMQVSVRLPREYFLPMKESESHKYDNMYPSVSRENISEN